MMKINGENSAKAEPQEEGTKVEEDKESQSQKQDRTTRYSQFFINKDSIAVFIFFMIDKIARGIVKENTK